MAITPALFAFFSGAAYLGLQALFLDKLAAFCDQPRAALMVHFYLLFVTILVASYIVEARPSKAPDRWLRLTGLMIMISHAAAFYVLTWWSPGKFGAFTSAWIGGLILTPAAVSGGIAFGKFIQVMQTQYPRSVTSVLCSIAFGALAAPRAKAALVVLGPTLSFALILLFLVATLTVIPAPSSEDKQPEAW